jgi:hypothetical protein
MEHSAHSWREDRQLSIHADHDLPVRGDRGVERLEAGGQVRGRAACEDAPVSPSKPQRLVLASHTIAFEVPSVVVTIGEPRPLFDEHHATAAVGGEPAVTLTTMRLPVPPELGHPTPPPCE